MCGTFHIYADERDLAQQVIAEDVAALELAAPSAGWQETAAALERWEQALRASAQSADEHPLRGLASEVSELEHDLVGQAARVYLLKAARVAEDVDVEELARRELSTLAALVEARRE
jgi:hypothetical protein